MSKEAQPFSIDQLQNKIGKINKAAENVEKALGKIGPSSFVRRTENLIALDETKPEDRIYMFARLGRARKKIKEVTIPYLNNKRDDFEANISELKIKDAQDNLNQLASLHEDGYISQEELETANKEFESLRPRPGITQLVPEATQELEVTSETEIRFNRSNNLIDILIGKTGEIREQTLTPSYIAILELLSKNEDPQGIPAEVVGKTANAGLDEKDKKPTREYIRTLRKLIEEDPKNPKILTDTGIKRGIRYQLHAKIIDVTESSITENTEFTIPDKVFYTSEDIVNLTGQPKTLILPRISAELKKDKTLNPWKVKGDARNRFTKEDLEKLLTAVGSPKKKEHKNGIQKKKEELSSEIDQASSIETPHAVDQKDDLRRFHIPNKGYYSTEDLAAIIRKPLPLIRSRVQAALRKDTTINPVHLHDEKTNFFNRTDLEKLIRMVSGPKSKRGRRPATSENLQVRPLISSASEPTEENDKKSKPTELELAKNRLQLDLARVLLSHFNARSIPTLSKRSMVFLKSCLPNGFDFKTIIGSELQEDVDNFVVNTFADILEKLWNSKEEISEIERQIKIDIEEIKAKGFDKSTIVRSVCKHFSINIPEAFRKKSKLNKGENRKRTKTPQEQNQHADIFHVSAAKKWNRRRPRAPKFPQHGGSLRDVIQPVIERKAKEAEEKTKN